MSQSYLNKSVIFNVPHNLERAFVFIYVHSFQDQLIPFYSRRSLQDKR